MSEHTATSSNIEDLRAQLPGDQAKYLEIGCTTMTFVYQPGSQCGHITIWPDGRAAICFGGDSVWGDYDEDSRLIKSDEGTIYDLTGKAIDN